MKGDKDTLYARWLSGDLTPGEESELKASSEWAELQAIANATDNMSLPAYNTVNAYKKLKTNRSPKPKVFSFRPLLSIAASAILLCAAFFLFKNKSFEVNCPNGQNLAFELPDQSKVSLNDGSSFTFKKRSYKNERSLTLNGEAYFEVEPGNKFEVITSNGIVTVLGTSFNVRAWGNKLYVKCNSGKVEVRSDKYNTILTAGTAVNLYTDRIENLNDLDTELPGWQKNISYFYEEDIKTVLEEIGRQFDKELIVSDVNRRFSGSFTHNDITGALDMVCKPMGLDYSIDSTGKISIK